MREIYRNEAGWAPYYYKMPYSYYAGLPQRPRRNYGGYGACGMCGGCPTCLGSYGAITTRQSAGVGAAIALRAGLGAVTWGLMGSLFFDRSFGTGAKWGALFGAGSMILVLALRGDELEQRLAEIS